MDNNNGTAHTERPLQRQQPKSDFNPDLFLESSKCDHTPPLLVALPFESHLKRFIPW